MWSSRSGNPPGLEADGVRRATVVEQPAGQRDRQLPGPARIPSCDRHALPNVQSPNVCSQLGSRPDRFRQPSMASGRTRLRAILRPENEARLSCPDSSASTASKRTELPMGFEVSAEPMGRAGTRRPRRDQPLPTTTTTSSVEEVALWGRSRQAQLPRRRSPSPPGAAHRDGRPRRLTASSRLTPHPWGQSSRTLRVTGLRLETLGLPCSKSLAASVLGHRRRTTDDRPRRALAQT